MKNICFYFQIHQPIKLKRYRFFDIGRDHYYYDDFQSEQAISYAVENSYINANKIIGEMIRSSNGKFKCAFSISGVTLEQLEQYAPEVIDSFKELAKTGSVEFLAEPYAHSLSSFFNPTEFELQIKKHAELIESLFGKKPTALRNSAMIYSDEIGELVARMGYKTMLIEEAKQVMGWKSPNYVYNNIINPKLKILVRNNRLSDDIAFRFNNSSWGGYPLTADKFIGWIADLPQEEKLVNLWMGYEALGIYQHPETGIFDFLKALPYHAMEKEIGFVMPSDATKKIESTGPITSMYPISWYGNEKDVSIWTGNDLQQEALSKLYAVSERVHLCNDKPLQHDWLMLQCTDHFHYMSYKDTYGSNFESPYDAFTNYMNILADFLERVDAQYPTTIENEELNELLKTINHQEKEIATLEGEIKKLRSKKAVQ
jgi:alpha-amylase